MKYKASLVEFAEQWISEHGLMDFGGAKAKDFWKAMGCDAKSYYNWLKKYPEFSEAVERGRERFKIEHTHTLFNTLMQTAIGGEKEVVDETTEYRPNPDDENKPKIVKMIKHKHKIFQRPDVGAAIFLLTNLDPEHWQNKMRNDVAIKKPNSNEDMSLDEIKDEIKRLTEG